MKWNCCFYAILLRKWTKTKNYQLNSYRLILYIHFCTKSSARFMWETDNEFNFLFLRIPCILNLLALPVNHFLCLCCLYSIQTRKKNNYNHTECLRLQHLKYTTFSYFLAANIQCSEGADWMWINVFITLFFLNSNSKKNEKEKLHI